MTRAHNQEDVAEDSVGEDGEGGPSASFPEVVSATHHVEAIASGNTTGSGARRSEVSESDVAHKVHELEESESSSKHEVAVFASASPRRLGVVRMEEEVHRQSHQQPVVRAVLENVEYGHRVVGEAMHVQSLELTLHIVAHHHRTSNPLAQRKSFLSLPEASPRRNKEAGNENRSEVLDQEDGSPANLSTNVFES